MNLVACVFAFLLLGSAPVYAQQTYSIGPWKLGMTRERVTSFPELWPYKPVASTGGYETSNARIQGKTLTVSFVFENDKLDFIQVWKYEGADFSEAKVAILEMYDELAGQFGGVTIPNIKVSGPNGLDRNAMGFMLDKFLGTAAELSAKWQKERATIGTFKFDMTPRTQPEGSQLHGQFGYSGRFKTYYVFLFQDRSGVPERHIETNVQLEPF